MQWPFDSHGSKNCYIELSEDSKKNDKITAYIDGEDIFSFSSWRDQWGVFYGANVPREYNSPEGLLIAQEDGTRSFISALIAALTEIQKRNELNTTLSEVMQDA